jgi:hypothetical protein
VTAPTPDLVAEALRDLARLRDPDGDPELEAVKAAIFLEDVFGITLTDAEIDPEALGSPAGLRSVVGRHGVTG